MKSWFAVLGLLFCAGAAAQAMKPTTLAPAQIERLAPAASRAVLHRLYEPGAFALLWVDSSGRPDANAREALSMLARADEDGLDPRDYRAASLAEAAAKLQSAGSPAESDVAAFDLRLSDSVLRYLRHLHSGRVDPRQAGFRVPGRHGEPDVAALLRLALENRSVTAAAAELRPAFSQYAGLRAALARYRTLEAAEPGFGTLAAAGTLRPGQTSADLPALHRRLVAFGDLPPKVSMPDASTAYEDDMVAGVRRFQQRHGLQDDGVIGRATWAALQMPLERRVRQIEFALERLRWLPDLNGQRMVAINIPMFRLWAAQPDRSQALTMRVIVGRSLNTQTPVFIGDMRHVIFRPYWNVPRSIVRGELLPLIARDPAYLRRHDMEIVRGAGDDAQPVEPTPQRLALLRDGVLRLRQRPGPRNSLGLVKFVFPNDTSVYLHGTPAPELFARTRRDFSHGCVRVEDPVALAQWVLGDQPTWTRKRIVEAVAGSRPLQVNLTRPLPVVLYYVTALAMPDGEVHFADDLYGHDARLESALATQRARLPGAHAAGVHMHEVRSGVITHATALQAQRRVAQLR